MRLPYEVDADDPNAPPIGLVVLQTDETIEPEFGRYFADHPSPLYVSRVPSGLEVTTHTLSDMADELTRAASLLPGPRDYAVVGYGCTSGSAVIGPSEVERLVKAGCRAKAVTNPLTAAVAACRNKGISRLALLSPYIEEVNIPLIDAFAAEGIEIAAVATFDEAVEERVVRISHKSVVEAACKVGADKKNEGIFISCTNLRTYDATSEVASRLLRPALSSNQAMAWHMRQLSGVGL